MNKQKYIVPEDLKVLFSKSKAYYDLSEIYTTKLLGYRKALKCAFKARRLNEKFWARVRKLYPELDHKHLTYIIGSSTFEVKERGEIK